MVRPVSRKGHEPEAKKHERKTGASISKEKTTESPPLRRKVPLISLNGPNMHGPDCRFHRSISRPPLSQYSTNSPPLTNGTVFFAPIAVPGTPLSPIFSTEMSLTWDRSDIFVVVADGDKKEECDSIPFLEKFQSTSEICKAGEEITRCGPRQLNWFGVGNW